MKCKFYAQNPAGFATNVCSGEGITCAVNYLLGLKAIISHYTQQVPSSKACSFSASHLIPAAYVIRRFSTEEAAGGVEDKFVYKENIPKSMCS